MTPPPISYSQGGCPSGVDNTTTTNNNGVVWATWGITKTDLTTCGDRAQFAPLELTGLLSLCSPFSLPLSHGRAPSPLQRKVGVELLMIRLICCKDSSNTVSVWGEQCTSENLPESRLRNIGEERQRSFNILLRAILVHVLAQKHGQKRLACSQTCFHWVAGANKQANFLVVHCVKKMFLVSSRTASLWFIRVHEQTV
jgi:hypothetical protein